jgi:hypothetical protein
MKLLILLSFLLGSAAVAAPIIEDNDDNSNYSVNTYNTFPGVQTNFVYRNGQPIQTCNTYYTFPGTSSTYCNR